VLAHMVSPGSHGLFQRAIVQSGAFALTQQSLATAETAGKQFAADVGSDQTAASLRAKTASELVSKYPFFAIPGVVDGKVLQESVGTAIANGRFARVPILIGTNHDEERSFLPGLVVSGGTFKQVPEVTPDSYQTVIASVLGVSAGRAAEIEAEYPLSEFASPTLALSALVGDATFAATSFQLSRWTSSRVPTYAYELNDDAAPEPYGAVLGPPVATHGSELAYLFGLPDAPVRATLDSDQEALADTMRSAWASFAATGNPSTSAVPWPSFSGGQVMSLVTPRPHVDTGYAGRHHVAFWTAN